MRHFTLIFFIIWSCIGYAQNSSVGVCGADAHFHDFVQRFPEKAAQHRLLEAEVAQLAKEYEENPAQLARMGTTIQVVFHVVYKNSEDNISNEQLVSQLDILNRDYRQMNPDQANTPAVFKPLAADMGIEFCLATRTPAGLPSTGITRRQTNYDNIGSLVTSDGRPRVRYASTGGTDAWDSERYLNIWVARIGSGLLGLATFPGTALAAEDGVVVDPRYIGDTGLAALNPPHHLGRTVTHEVGHYLDLRHLWGSEEGDCDNDDGVGDTPPQRYANLGCPTHPQMSCGVVSMFMNFMDYTNDACQNIFTQGQKARVLAALAIYRPKLLQNNAVCQSISTNNPSFTSFGSQFRIFPNPVGEFLFVQHKNEFITGLPYRIFSTNGQLVQSGYLDSEGVRIHDLQSGVYFLEIQSTNSREVLRLVLSPK